MNPPAKTYKNRVLAALPKAEIDRLAPHLSPVTLKVRTQLQDGQGRLRLFPGRGAGLRGLDSGQRSHS